MQLLTHGISAGALFATAGMLKERLHTRDIGQMGGLWSLMPTMGASAILFTMASLGLPLLGNFVAEFLILLGVFQLNAGFAVIASTGLIFSALYSLRMLQKVFLGPAKVSGTVRDFNGRELFIMSALALGIIVLGVYPQPVMDMVKMVLVKVTASL
jgi:NADH-quinone oxidoreductase subunit M